MSSHADKAGGALFGNAIAYFVIKIVLVPEYIEAEDAVEAVTMGGAVVTYALLYAGNVVRFFGNLIKARATGKK